MRWLAIASSFHPLVVSLAMPMAVVAVATGLAVLSRPLVDLIDAGLSRLERRRAARGRRPVITPRTIAAAVVVGAAGVAVFSWFVSIRPRIGHFDLVLFVHPLVALAVLAAAHGAWRRWPRARMPGGIAAATLVVALTAGALWVRTTRPSLLLEVWSRPTIAGLSIDEVFDLDAVRSEMTLTAFRPTARPAARHPDVVLITIDTVRYDRTPVGGGPARMPVLAALGARGAVFDWAFSPGNVTRRSIPSIVLGDSATRVRGRVAGWALRLDPRHVLLAERFKAAGYDTAAFVCCASFWAPRHKLGINRGLDHLYINESGRTLAEAARAWLEERDSTHPRRPLFMWMHFIEVHNWNGDHPHPQFTDADRKRYDRVLSEVDHYLGTVVTAFAQRPPGEQPIIVITADHGEGLGDHGVPYHSDGMYDSQIHVPAGHRRARASRPATSTSRSSLVDLAPTMLDLAGFVPPGLPEMDGRSIADLVTGTRNPDPDRGYAFAAQIKDRSVATGERALIVGPVEAHLRRQPLRALRPPHRPARAPRPVGGVAAPAHPHEEAARRPGQARRHAAVSVEIYPRSVDPDRPPAPRPRRHHGAQLVGLVARVPPRNPLGVGLGDAQDVRGRQLARDLAQALARAGSRRRARRPPARRSAPTRRRPRAGRRRSAPTGRWPRSTASTSARCRTCSRGA